MGGKLVEGIRSWWQYNTLSSQILCILTIQYGKVVIIECPPFLKSCTLSSTVPESDLFLKLVELSSSAGKRKKEMKGP